MKKLAVLAVLLISVQSKGACHISLMKKTPTAKTFYTNQGNTISKSVIKKLSSECTFDISLMSSKMKTQIDIKRLKARLAKLKGGL